MQEQYSHTTTHPVNEDQRPLVSGNLACVNIGTINCYGNTLETQHYDTAQFHLKSEVKTSNLVSECSSSTLPIYSAIDFDKKRMERAAKEQQAQLRKVSRKLRKL